MESSTVYVYNRDGGKFMKIKPNNQHHKKKIDGTVIAELFKTLQT